ncbi:MAG TPA: hypothetical protein VF082_09375 [Jiangellaceae bacterium]
MNDAGRGGHGVHRIEICVDRLGEVPTGELSWLAERFHVVTVRMYEELCARRAAAGGAGKVEALWGEWDGGAR